MLHVAEILWQAKLYSPEDMTSMWDEVWGIMGEEGTERQDMMKKTERDPGRSGLINHVCEIGGISLVAGSSAAHLAAKVPRSTASSLIRPQSRDLRESDM